MQDDDRTQSIGAKAATIAVALCVVGAFGAIWRVETRAEHLPVLEGLLVLTGVGAIGLAFLVPWRTRMLRGQSHALQTQERILRAAAFAAERLAQPDGQAVGLDEVLARFGGAAGVGRVYLYENREDPVGRRTMSIVREWVADGVAPTIDDPENQDFPYANGFATWEHELQLGHVVRSVRSDVDAIERADMDSESVLSTLTVPITVGGEWWGFLGFDDGVTERRWTPTEVDALMVAAGTLGAAIGRERAMTESVEAKERFRVLVEHAPAVVYIDGLDDTASTLYMSPRIEELVGYTVEEWHADPELWPKLLHPEDREAALEATARHNDTGEPFRTEYRLIARDGRTVWIRDEAIMIYGADGAPVHSQGIMQDITATKLAEEHLEYLAYHDRLTGLPNTAMFKEVATMAIARAKRSAQAAAILYLDVDGFKLANDTLGPEGGDRLLLSISQRLQGVLRETDTLARRGGDEFLILLADLDAGSIGEMQAPLLFAESVAGRIQEVFTAPFAVDATEVFISISVGISVFPSGSDELQSLIVQAETAMLASKQAGPGGFAASEEGAVDAATKLAFVTKLRRAVAREAWMLHYQPIVQLATGGIVGVEALLRWRDEDGEIIPPNEFIPLAEELGLIEKIGDWVVEEIVRQDEHWRTEGVELEMGFNLSPRQFWQPDLAQRILSRLDVRGVDPSKVMVEITESSAMRDPERAHDVLWDLHARGLRVAIDDFGTGYSSLSRLRSFPIDVLKIDRSFVSHLDQDPEAAHIVGAFIQLGHGLGMTTLAEGIETEGEWRFLAEQGCELGQGFYFSRPVPADEISARILAGELTVATTA
jgi:diguanylate cyclase (GGDEF)-like protein/PAS domain S-box-containing protein